MGFSSGITTGVWMGRDNARAVGGLQGGRAPAQAFAQYMKVAVAKRPVEQFETEVTLPEWQLEPDEESYFGQPDDGVTAVDADGNLYGTDNQAGRPQKMVPRSDADPKHIVMRPYVPQ